MAEVENIGMVDRSPVHEWVNTGIAAVALIASIAVGAVEWLNHKAKREALAITARPNYDCRTEYHGHASGGVIGLCWSVTVVNTSENRLSVVGYGVLGIDDRNTVEIGGIRNLEAADGAPLFPPFTLDGGEAREITVRAGFYVPPDVAQAIAGMPEYQNGTLSSLPFGAVQRKLAAAKIDAVGNIVQPMIVDGQVMGSATAPPYKRSVNVLSLTTGGGATFSARLAYPPER